MCTFDYLFLCVVVVVLVWSLPHCCYSETKKCGCTPQRKSLTKNTKKKNKQSGSSTTTTQANTQQKCDE
jgi:hypothetical protein